MVISAVKMRLCTICLSIMIAAIMPVQAQRKLVPGWLKECTDGNVTGPGYRYHLDKPDGWNMSTSSNAQKQVIAIISPDRKKFTVTTACMFGHVLERKGMTLSQVIDQNLKTNIGNSQTVRTTDQAPLSSSSGQTAVVKELTGLPYDTTKRIAYFEEKNWVIVLNLDTHNQSEIPTSLPIFEQLVKSYRYVSDGQTPPSNRAQGRQSGTRGSY